MRGVGLTLREYQQHLFDRLHAIAGAEQSSSHLGFEAGEWTWVVPLRDVAEVVPVPRIASIPLVEDWLVGVANVRGNLFAVTDLGRFAGAVLTAIGTESRLIVLHARYKTHAALLVRRSLGLRQARPAAQGESPNTLWCGTAISGAESGDAWRELSVQNLVRNPSFLRPALQTSNTTLGNCKSPTGLSTENS